MNPFIDGFCKGFTVTAVTGLFIFLVIKTDEVNNEPEIKPCICVSYSQYALWSEKYNRFVSENKPDSVAKYAELLNQIK